jgi:hypothetical protein
VEHLVPKYFFVIQGDLLVEDTVGTEFPTDEAARDHADLVVRELTRGDTDYRSPLWSIMVDDERGRVIYRTRFDQVPRYEIVPIRRR